MRRWWWTSWFLVRARSILWIRGGALLGGIGGQRGITVIVRLLFQPRKRGELRVFGSPWLEVYIWKDKFLLFGRRENLVEVYGDAEGDEEESADTRLRPVRGLEWRWGNELFPEGAGAVRGEDWRGIRDRRRGGEG